MKLSDMWPYLNNVKEVTIYRNPKFSVDLDHKEKYEVVSISSIYHKPGLDVKVKPI